MGEWWEQVAEALRDEFADLDDAARVTRLAVRLALAALLGGVLGFERERKGKPAGLRTHMLVAMASALFILVPQQAGYSEEGLSRVLQGLLAGIGFLGAGAILKDEGHRAVKGLTTAAGLWTTAAIGVAAGLGRGATAIVSTLLALAILESLHRLARAFAPPDKPDDPDREAHT